MYTPKINNTSPVHILSTLMPQVIPLLTLSLLHMLNDESTPLPVNETLSRMIVFWMKNHLVGDNNYKSTMP